MCAQSIYKSLNAECFFFFDKVKIFNVKKRMDFKKFILLVANHVTTPLPISHLIRRKLIQTDQPPAKLAKRAGLLFHSIRERATNSKCKKNQPKE
jgi:hypothetical protein